MKVDLCFDTLSSGFVVCVFLYYENYEEILCPAFMSVGILRFQYGADVWKRHQGLAAELMGRNIQSVGWLSGIP